MDDRDKRAKEAREKFQAFNRKYFRKGLIIGSAVWVYVIGLFLFGPEWPIPVIKEILDWYNRISTELDSDLVEQGSEIAEELKSEYDLRKFLNKLDPGLYRKWKMIMWTGGKPKLVKRTVITGYGPKPPGRGLVRRYTSDYWDVVDESGLIRKPHDSR